ncbi:MAG TPA: DUF2191 domain-containing protein [Gammaproteobacteria bacterium]|nr:DUF2191 domain-containing protein [Gammaproteobacteria bacterium]
MKTTIEIADALLEDAKRMAARDGITVRALIESGLRRELAARNRPVKFRLRKATVKGQGLQEGAEGLSSDQVRELTYTGRGT